MEKKNNFKIELEQLYDQNMNYKKTIIKMQTEINMIKNELNQKQKILNIMNEEIEQILTDNKDVLNLDITKSTIPESERGRYAMIGKMKNKIKEAEAGLKNEKIAYTVDISSQNRRSFFMAEKKSNTFDGIMADMKKGVFAPVYILMGEEPYYIDAISNYILEHALQPEERDFNQTVLYGIDVDNAEGAARVVNMAKEYGMTSKEMLGHLHDMKIPAKAAFGTAKARNSNIRSCLISVSANGHCHFRGTFPAVESLFSHLP